MPNRLSSTGAAPSWRRADSYVPFIVAIVVAAIGGFFWHQSERSAVVTQNFTLREATIGTVGIVSLTVTHRRRDEYRLNVELDNATKPVDLRFYFQPDVTKYCPAPSPVITKCDTDDPSIGEPLQLVLSAGTSVSVIANITAPIFTYSANGERAEGWLPYVICPGPCQGSDDTPTVFRVIYDFRHASSYDWDSGIGLQGRDAVFQQTASQLQEPVLYSGTDPRADQRDQRDIFLAGILLGLAAGLMAAALQAILAARETRVDGRPEQTH